MTDAILRNEPLGFPWPGVDPFLFCVHHVDHFPAATSDQAVPAPLLAGRQLGNDFSGRDGFSMYHGAPTPGFPAHPHRGFETVTIVERGLVDHADSLGAAARYGDGDVQWLTAGRGAMHSEMFPLRDTGAPNPLDLFQIWLNLPARSKMAEPAFRMLWAPEIPVYRAGAGARVKVIAGSYAPQEGSGPILLPPPPAPDSWASDPASDVAIWEIGLAPGACLVLPPAVQGRARRTLYLYAGAELTIAGQPVAAPRLVEVVAGRPLPLANDGADEARVLLLQGAPIGEPVVQHGPFVMNTAAEISQAMTDFQRTRFGGWPWPSQAPVHPAGKGRFAQVPGEPEATPPSPSAPPSG